MKCCDLFQLLFGSICHILRKKSFVSDVLKHLVQRRRHGVIALHQHLVELSVWIDGLGDTLRQEDNEFVQWTGHHVLTKLHTFQVRDRQSLFRFWRKSVWLNQM